MLVQWFWSALLSFYRITVRHTVRRIKTNSVNADGRAATVWYLHLLLLTTLFVCTLAQYEKFVETAIIEPSIFEDSTLISVCLMNMLVGVCVCVCVRLWCILSLLLRLLLEEEKNWRAKFQPTQASVLYWVLHSYGEKKNGGKIEWFSSEPTNTELESIEA